MEKLPKEPVVPILPTLSIANYRPDRDVLKQALTPARRPEVKDGRSRITSNEPGRAPA